MSSNSRNALSDLRGASRLTVDAIVGVTDLVESMHRSVWTLGGLIGDADRQRMPGVSGVVFQNVRTIADLVGGGLDRALAPLVSLVGEMEPSPGREAVVAALNGVLGNHLAATDNPLAISMSLRQDGEQVSPTDPAFQKAIEEANGRVVLLLHGSAANDLQWRHYGHDYGATLADELGVLPLYLHYNSGRHISQNGRELAGLLETFLADLPTPVTLTFVGHSMGGLVARSACYYARLADHQWLDALQTFIGLGTPHHGAPLERYGNWVDHLLTISPYSAPFARLGKIRSAGITDLRYGNLLDEDWQGRDRFEKTSDPRRPVPLPEGIDCYAIAGTRSDNVDRPIEDLRADGMIPVASALGLHDSPERTLQFPKEHRRIVPRVSHLGLLGNSEVYQTLQRWLEKSARR